MCFDRLLLMKIKAWRAKYIDTRKAYIVASIVFTILFICNIHIPFTIQLDYDTISNSINSSSDSSNNGFISCHSTSMHKLWLEVT